jgi:hypothetical protein
LSRSDDLGLTEQVTLSEEQTPATGGHTPRLVRVLALAEREAHRDRHSAYHDQHQDTEGLHGTSGRRSMSEALVPI